LVFIIGSTVLVNLIFIALTLFKSLRTKLISFIKHPVTIQQAPQPPPPLIEAKAAKRKYRMRPKAVIEESMYIDDGRYKGPEEIRNAAFRLHRSYLLK
jgi:hypothetical protein